MGLKIHCKEDFVLNDQHLEGCEYCSIGDHGTAPAFPASLIIIKMNTKVPSFVPSKRWSLGGNRISAGLFAGVMSQWGMPIKLADLS